MARGNDAPAVHCPDDRAVTSKSTTGASFAPQLVNQRPVQSRRISFPGREKEFSCGVEIGVLSYLMGSGEPAFRRWISRDSLDQVKALATALGYLATVEQEYEDQVDISCRNAAFMVPKRKGSHLRLVK